MIYLDNSATTRMKPAAVADAVRDSLEESANPGRSGHRAALAAAENVLLAREGLLRIVDGKGCHCVFGLNCTHALNTAIFGTARYGHVVTTVTEHNSVLRPLFDLSRKGMIRLTTLAPDKSGNITPEAIKRACCKDTYLVAVNLTSNVTGKRQDVGEIGAFCRLHDILFLADGAQAVGYTPVSMNRDCIDLLAVAPHKGLHAPMGAGALIVGDRVSLSPFMLGGTGTDSRNPVQVPILPEGLEAGTLPYPALCGLAAAVPWWERHAESCAKANLRMSELLIEGLVARKFPCYSRPNAAGVVSFNLPNLPSATVADELDARGICIRGGLHCAPLMHDYLGTALAGACRASFSCDNAETDADELLRALDEIVSL